MEITRFYLISISVNEVPIGLVAPYDPSEISYTLSNDSDEGVIMDVDIEI